METQTSYSNDNMNNCDNIAYGTNNTVTSSNTFNLYITIDNKGIELLKELIDRIFAERNNLETLANELYTVYKAEREKH